MKTDVSLDVTSEQTVGETGAGSWQLRGWPEGFPEVLGPRLGHAPQSWSTVPGAAEVQF